AGRAFRYRPLVGGFTMQRLTPGWRPADKLEPISKSPEEDNEAGELNKGSSGCGCYVAALDVTDFAPAERDARKRSPKAVGDPDPRNHTTGRLLSARCEWQRCRRAAEQRDELASFQLIELHFGPREPGPNCRISNCQGPVSRLHAKLLNQSVNYALRTSWR